MPEAIHSIHSAAAEPRSGSTTNPDSPGSHPAETCESSYEAIAIRQRIERALGPSFPELAAFLAHGAPDPVQGDPMHSLADDAASLAELLAMAPEASEATDTPPSPQAVAHCTWLIERLLSTGRRCQPQGPDRRFEVMSEPQPDSAQFGIDHPVKEHADSILAGNDPKAAVIVQALIAEGEGAELHLDPEGEDYPPPHPTGKHLVVLLNLYGTLRGHWYVHASTAEALRPAVAE